MIGQLLRLENPGLLDDHGNVVERLRNLPLRIRAIDVDGDGRFAACSPDADTLDAIKRHQFFLMTLFDPLDRVEIHVDKDSPSPSSTRSIRFTTE